LFLESSSCTFVVYTFLLGKLRTIYSRSFTSLFRYILCCWQIQTTAPTRGSAGISGARTRASGPAEWTRNASRGGTFPCASAPPGSPETRSVVAVVSLPVCYSFIFFSFHSFLSSLLSYSSNKNFNEGLLVFSILTHPYILTIILQIQIAVLYKYSYLNS
jgi:hypothetical protein